MALVDHMVPEEEPVDEEEEEIADRGDDEEAVEEDDMEPEEEPVDEEEEEIADRGDDEEEDQEEEGQDEYEKDGFIVDDVEEEEPEAEEDKDSDEERHKKKKRKKRDSEKNFELDEDDYDLLQDANVRVNRPRAENKKFKRLKKAQRDSLGHHSGLFDEDEYDATGERKIQRSLFDDDGHLEDMLEEEEPKDVEYEDMGGEDDMGDEDDMADFIVDEEEGDEYGAPVRRKKTSKKKFRQAPGVTSMALQEALEIFGDVEEFLKLRQTNLENRGRYEESGGRERRLEDEFEPAIVAEKYMTERDDQVRKIDVPERLQILEESTGPPPTDADAVAEEVKWICEQLDLGTVQLFGGKINEIEDGTVIRKEIENFLQFTHVQKFDVPFIAMYRRDDCLRLINDTEQDDSNRVGPSLKWHKALWTLQELDKKWLLLQKRKCALEAYYHKVYEEESRRLDDETRLSFNKQIFKSTVKALGEAESEREVDDVDIKFNLHFPFGEVDSEERPLNRPRRKFKRPSRKSRYSTCCRAGLWMAASKFGNSEQLGLRISLTEVGVDEREDLKETPEEMASNFTCALFETPQSVLEGARHMAAVEISCEPVVRKHLRQKYFDKAVVSTCPTADGNTVIDSFHEFAGVKCLRNKPLREFVDAQWLLIQKAEEEKLIQVKIKLPEDDLNKEISEFRDYYHSDSVTKSAELWNKQRELILKDAIYKHSLPSLEKEARALLFSRAKSWLLSEYGKLLWDKVSVAPYLAYGHNANSDEEAAPRLMVCCWGPGKPATTFVVLDAYGEIVDVLEAGSINLRTHNVMDEQRKENDQQNLLRFLAEHKPTRVVVGAANLSCTRLKDDINEFVFKILEDNPRDIHHELGEGGTIFLEDESIARLYENSRISSDQLSGQSGVVKRAVALGRRLQNPLAMVAALCGPGREILSWELSPLEKYLSADEKYMMIEQIMVDVTNQVGLDLNLAANHEWLFAPLQFISGLGPRKAASLQRSIVRHSGLSSRKDLLTIHELGKKVFVNAAGFLRVRRCGLATTTSLYFDLLDDTRIHPESYGLAQDMAQDICRKFFGDENLDDKDSLEMAVDYLRERPDILKSFDVDAYAADQEDPVRHKRETLYLIKSELIQGFQDRRKPYIQPTPDDVFFMITGETEETLVDGRPVQATVRRVQAQKAICALESGLTGMLMKEDCSDDLRDGDLTQKLHEGDTLTCKIKNIQKNRYLVYLTCRDDSRSSRHNQTERNLDPYYHEDSNSSLLSDKEKAQKEKELAKKYFKRRMIVHPCFQNITADEAMKFLADKDPGGSVIRPSSRGPSYLTLTLKVYDGVYAHKDIVEGGKEHKDITSWLRIGKTLRIGEDSFEDLDEVMDRYVDPLVTHLKTMLNYRKFRRGTKAEVDELLRAEKQMDLSKIVYSFGISHEHPGTFILTYIQRSNPYHEYIGLYPKGFKFRKKMFENIDKLVFYFQRHINDPMHESQSLQHIAAVVPMRRQAQGGGRGGDYQSSGGSRDGHPSGVRRPYGGGRCRGFYDNKVKDGGSGPSDYKTSSRWSSDVKGDGNKGGSWSDIPGAKVQNSLGREALIPGWGNDDGLKVWRNGGGGGWDGEWGSSGGGSGGGNDDGFKEWGD